MSIIIIYEAYRRFFEPIEFHSLPMVIVAVIGLIVNIAGMYILRGERVHDHGTSKNNDKAEKSASVLAHSDNSKDPFHSGVASSVFSSNDDGKTWMLEGTNNNKLLART